MSALSTVALLLAGCSVHVGVLPVRGSWSVADVVAPVAEADVDDWVEEAATASLAARRALDPAGGALRIVVTEAAWSPARRSGDVLLYEARLSLRLEADGRSVTRTRSWTVVDPGDAASARRLREDTFRALARQATDDGVTWLLAR